MNKEIILQQLKVVEDNAARLRTLVECDLANVPDANVPLYCSLQIKLNAEELERTFSAENARLAGNKQIKQ